MENQIATKLKYKSMKVYLVIKGEWQTLESQKVEFDI